MTALAMLFQYRHRPPQLGQNYVLLNRYDSNRRTIVAECLHFFHVFFPKCPGTVISDIQLTRNGIYNNKLTVWIKFKAVMYAAHSKSHKNLRRPISCWKEFADTLIVMTCQYDSLSFLFYHNVMCAKGFSKFRINLSSFLEICCSLSAGRDKK